MRTKYLLFGAIFTIFGFAVRAQVYEMYYQGFENGETQHFNVSSPTNYSYENDLASSGSRSLKLVQSTSENIVLITDTIDFSQVFPQSATSMYVTLEFDHINNITAVATGSSQVAEIFVKRYNQNDNQWSQLNSAVYNTTEGTYSTAFQGSSAFNLLSYPGVWNQNPLTNDCWRHERFDFTSLFDGVLANDRKVQFKFTLRKRTSTTPHSQAWWIDNIRVRASQNEMKRPMVSMVNYPDGGGYPNSRGANIVLQTRTTVAQGINSDSVYLYYTVGSDSTKVRVQMTPMGTYTDHTNDHSVWRRFGCRLPFFGYDTLMRFYCVVKDSTTNANEATFPSSANSWAQFWYMRGTEQPGEATPQFTGSSNISYPFPAGSDNKTEWVFDSALLAAAGYGPGAITDLRFTSGTSLTAQQTRNDFQLRMKNVPTSYNQSAVVGEIPSFMADYMQVVYDGNLNIGPLAAGDEFTIHLQDTFFYSGGDLLVQTIYNNVANGTAVSIKGISAPNNKKTIYRNAQAAYSANPYTENDFLTASDIDTKRPAAVITEHANLPLLHDMGVSAIVYPSSTNAVMSVPTHIDVTLNNYGSEPVNAVRISYSVDDTLFGHFDWNAGLAAGASSTVTIENNLVLPAGFHYMNVWVEDTVTAAGGQYRDHEPYNDSSRVEFIVCEGALGGVRQIGGTNANYNTIDEFLFSLTRCGMDDSLVVKLAPGEYPPFAMSEVFGHSREHYIVFESLDPNHRAVLYADANTGTDYIVDLAGESDIHFRNLNFVRYEGPLTSMIGLDENCSRVSFQGCSFKDQYDNNAVAQRIPALLSTNKADSITIENCYFEGGVIGVNVTGTSAAIRSVGNVVRHNTFRNQYFNAVKVENQDNILVDHNEMYDVLNDIANVTNYVLQVTECQGDIRLTGNRVYTSHGAGAIGVSALHGVDTNHAIVANNMIVCNDNGVANTLIEPLGVVGSEWTDVVYNSIKMNAPTRNNISAASFGGGGAVISNCRFMNNIVASFDATNYALNYMPGGQVSNQVGHNIYYSSGAALNRRQGSVYQSLAQWRMMEPADTASKAINPAYLDGSLLDLRTFNRQLKGVGYPIQEVLVDIYDSIRATDSTCPGAFEFVALYYDFEIEELVSPLADVCDMPDSVELVFRVRNNGVSNYTENCGVTMNLAYRIGNGAVSTFLVTDSIPAEGSALVHAGVNLNLPANGIHDVTYGIDAWTICASDPNQTNDTSHYQVVSRYHSDAPDDVNHSSTYMDPAVVTVTAGVDQWSVYEDTTAEKLPSTVYWYHNMDDEEPFFKGNTLTTTELRHDTSFYISQHRELPIVRITQIMMKSTGAVGLPSPMPSWMASQTSLAVQLTNIGDDTAFLQGDTLLIVSTTPNTNVNNKTAVFGDVFIAPGKSLVVQFNNGTSSNTEVTVYSGSRINPNSKANMGFVYRHAGHVEDAVPLNSVITTAPPATQTVKWASQNVPSYVWSGDALEISAATVGGIIRTGFSGTASDWTEATNVVPVNFNNIDPSWILYKDNGCPGDKSTVTITISNPPSTDIDLAPVQMAGGCGMGNETVAVHVRNYGDSAIVGMQLNYSLGGIDTVQEFLADSIRPGDDTLFTFAQTVNMAFANDSLVKITIWATSRADDPMHANDTVKMNVMSLFTPEMPNLSENDTTWYAERDTLAIAAQLGRLPVWYDNAMNPIDTGMTYVTDILYSGITVGVGYIATKLVTDRIGSDNTITGKTAYPSPYQPNNKNVKQQYIYTADELTNMGLGSGYLYSLAFHLDSIYGNRDSIIYKNFNIALGTTEDTVFASTTSWKDVTLYYERDSMVVRRSSSHDWVWHELDRPYYWDGESTLVVQVSFENDANITTGLQTAYTTTAENTVLYNATNNAMQPSVLEFVGTGKTDKKRPNIMLSGEVFGCNGPIKVINIGLIGIPDHDANLSWPAGSDTISYNTCSNVEPMVVVSNYGDITIDSVNLIYYIDGAEEADTTVITNTNILGGASSALQLFSRPLTPGRHSVKVVVDIEGDTIRNNDTITGVLLVRFCGGIYTVSTDSTGDFLSIKEAVDTLNVVGIDGSVVFNVNAGTYNEQVLLNDVYGASQIKTITFRGLPNDSVQVCLIGNTTAAENYVFKLNGASHVTIDGLTMISRPLASGVKAGKVLVMNAAEDVVVKNSTLKVKPGLNDTAAVCISLYDGCNGVRVMNNTLDSGSCSITTKVSDDRYQNVSIVSNTLSNFSKIGVELNGVTILNVTGNDIRSSVTGEVKGLFFTNVDSTISITKNKIYLNEGQSGKKWGMQLVNLMGSGFDGGLVANNMVGASSSGSQSVGIYLDGNSSNLSIYYNTVKIYAGNTEKNAKAFYAGANTSDLRIMNNLFSSFSPSYAYYISSGNSVTSSDFNGYYNAGNTKLAYWGSDKNTLAALKTANNKDVNSVESEPFFVSDDDLHLLMTNFCTKAQYNGNVIDDIDGKARPVSYNPTIGAHEMDQLTHNMTVLRVTEPVLPANTSNPLNIESDPIHVTATFFNNGSSVESNVSWYAYVEGAEEETRSATRSLGTFQPSQMKTDTLSIPTILGIINEHTVRIVLVSPDDEDTVDNTKTAPVYLAPAFNLQAVKVAATGTACAMTNAAVAITVKNVGSKDMPAGTSFDISYTVQPYHPSYVANNPDSNKVTIATMPTGVITETYTLTQTLTKTGNNSQTVITFNTPANIYPTDTSLNLKVAFKGWLNYQYDISNSNDTTAVAIVDSYYKPRPPVGNDVTVPYGTWASVTASQNMGHVIRWYRSPTATTPFYAPTGTNAYAKSCLWNTTPQYFHDSTYYLMCISDKNCSSDFSTVTVNVAPRIAKDAAMEAVLAPLGAKVYMENDTVRVRIANYGTQSISNIPVTYQLRAAKNTNPVQEVTQVCTANISAGQTYVFTFDTLLHFANPTSAGTYYLRVWTDLPADQIRRNDTIRTKLQERSSSINNVDLDYSFTSLAESKYPSRNNSPSSATDDVDIIRFSFNGIDVDLPALGRTYTNFGAYNNPEWPVLHVTRGMRDSIYLMITNPHPEDPTLIERGKVAAYIDFNRDGDFTDSGECVLPVTNLYNNTLLASEVVISNKATLGHMKMRVVATNNSGNPTSNLGGTSGHVMDFLLFVDKQPVAKDVAFQQIVSPRNYLIMNDDSTVVTFRMANRGSQPVTNLEIFYNFDAEVFDSANSGSIQWTGNLMPGTSVNVDLPKHVFDLGTTSVHIWHNMNGDVVADNNDIVYEYHRFHTITLEVIDNFDSLRYWYAPTGYNRYTHNYWQCGTPNKTKIRHPHSAPNAWVTDVDTTVVTGTRGNVSYLYSPLIDITQIKPDTLSFYLSRNLLSNSSMYLEYYDYQNNWVKVISDTGVDASLWYNNADDGVFTGNDTTYRRKAFCTSEISGNFQEKVQLRFVYTTPQANNANASFGDGCAIDNLHIARARRAVDHGVIAITQPTAPQYGQTIYPEVVVKNFGYDTLRNLSVGYLHYGTNLAKVSSFTCNIPPYGGIDTFQMTAPFVITSEYPDTVWIQAFTISPADIYKDNDSASRKYILLPLDNDISADGFITPYDNVIAGDSITVTMRIRNFGSHPIRTARLSYILNNNLRYDEDIDFVQVLGHPFDRDSMEFFNYTFRHKFRASMGVMNIVGIAKCDSNDYIYNDTIHKQFYGISSITDVAASSIVLDQSSGNNVKVQLVIENRGARGVNNFEVGYYVNGDVNNVIRETYRSQNQIPALSNGYHVFQHTLPISATPYNITAFVNAPDDNDRTNDTTESIVEPFADMEAVAVIVEENARPDCRVFMRVRNNGNVTTAGRLFRLIATVNGNVVEYATSNRTINPGTETIVSIQRTIPKDPNRRYTGYGVVELAGDSVPENNQTSHIIVANYVEGVPTVSAGQYVLEQNYPNPFSEQTTIPFSLPEASNVRFFVMDATGHIVYTTSGFYTAGDNKLSLDMSAYPAGVYYYGIETTSGRLMRKMILR